MSSRPFSMKITYCDPGFFSYISLVKCQWLWERKTVLHKLVDEILCLRISIIWSFLGCFFAPVNWFFEKFEILQILKKSIIRVRFRHRSKWLRIYGDVCCYDVTCELNRNYQFSLIGIWSQIAMRKDSAKLNIQIALTFWILFGNKKITIITIIRLLQL